jgi:hypothetical protein
MKRLILFFWLIIAVSVIVPVTVFSQCDDCYCPGMSIIGPYSGSYYEPLQGGNVDFSVCYCFDASTNTMEDPCSFTITMDDSYDYNDVSVSRLISAANKAVMQGYANDFCNKGARNCEPATVTYIVKHPRCVKYEFVEEDDGHVTYRIKHVDCNDEGTCQYTYLITCNYPTCTQGTYSYTRQQIITEDCENEDCFMEFCTTIIP